MIKPTENNFLKHTTMKTKMYTLAAVALLAMSSLSARNLNCDPDDSTKCSRDINIGVGGEYHFWEGLDIGVNGYMNKAYSIETPSGYNFLELDYARSRSFSWNMAQYNLHIYKNYAYLVTGIGFEWNSYAFRNPVTLTPNAPTVSAVTEPYNFSKNKLKTTWVNVPLMLEFNTNGKNEEKSLHIGMGATFGYNIFRNRVKQEYEVNGQEFDRKVKDNYNINPFRASATARVGYGDFTLFANYGLTELFKENRGPKVYPFSAGVSLGF
jgi:Outer membrane protein beta-barrel domain